MDSLVAAVALVAAALQEVGDMNKKFIPRWLKLYLSDTGLDQIEQAVATAETKTSGEVVPMVVRSSSTTGHVPVILFCMFWIGYFVLGGHELLQTTLAVKYTPYYDLALMIPFILLSSVLSRSLVVQRSLVSPDDRILQVAQRSEVEFYHANLHETDGSTGILIFVSMMEHRVVVLADRAISKKLPAETWDGIVKMILSSLKKRDLATGLCQAIDRCGELLEPNFPIQPNDKNELHNHLVIKE